MKEINIYKAMKDSDYKIRLNGNECFKDTNEEDLINILLSLKDIKLNRYPDTDAVKLREAYGKIAGVPKENIIAGNGSDEMIALVIGAVISKGKKVLALSPDFSMFDFYTASNEGIMVKLNTSEDGSFAVKDFIALGKEVAADLIILSNPNNPTGHTISISKIKRILESFPNSKVLIDEAYFEFNGITAIPYINDYDNLIVTRTLSKAWGLAAIRVGFLIANESLVKELSNYKVPYNINQLSQDIACEVLKSRFELAEIVKNTVSERDRLYGLLKEIEAIDEDRIKVYKSRSNFIFCRSKYKNEIQSVMEDYGVLLRYFNDDSFRISVGNSKENDFAVEVLKIALGYEGDIYERETGAS